MSSDFKDKRLALYDLVERLKLTAADLIKMFDVDPEDLDLSEPRKVIDYLILDQSDDPEWVGETIVESLNKKGG